MNISKLVLSVATCLAIPAGADHVQVLNHALSIPATVRPSSEINAVTTLATLNVGVSANYRRYSARVRNCGNDISHLKIEVLNNPLAVDGLGATFSDGTSQNFSYSTTLEAGYVSSWLDIGMFKSQDQCVTSVYVNARSAGNGTSKVRVYGNMK